MNYFLLLCTACLLAVQSLCFKEFNRKYMNSTASFFLFNTLFFTVVTFIFLVSGISFGEYHTVTVGLGMLFGFTFIVAVFCYMKAMETGPFSFSVLFNSFGILIPILAGLIFWNEPVKWLQVLGLLLLFATFYLGASSANGSKQAISVRWLLFCLACFLGNGMVLTILKWHQMVIPGEEMKEFLAISFGSAAVLSLVCFIALGPVKKQPLFKVNQLHLLIVVVITGVVTAYGNQLIVHLASRIPSVIQFPAINGGIVIISTLASSVLFKEQLGGKEWSGIAIGIVALVLLSI